MEDTCDAFFDHCSLLRRLLFLAEEFPWLDHDGFDTAMADNRSLTTPDLQNYQSTASAPSLRSKEPVEIMDRPRSSDGDGGNVKVVVRVRKFIKRGMHYWTT